eukprot:jgi/Psemu1/14648/gm1.14648_g
MVRDVSVGTDILNLPKLPMAARGCPKFNVVGVPLVLVPELCQHGCKVNFGATTRQATVTNPGGETVLIGNTEPQMEPLHGPTTPSGSGPGYPTTKGGTWGPAEDELNWSSLKRMPENRPYNTTLERDSRE